MAICKPNFTIILIVISITMLLIAVNGEGPCKGDLRGLITNCAEYVKKPGPVEDPSQSCCDVIKAVDIPCACKFITKAVEAVIDMAKVVHVAAFCGTPLPPGMKCGSYVVPPKN